MAGLPDALVHPCVSIASTMRAGSTFAGLVGSMSGITTVMPSAIEKSPKSGKHARSISPGSMPIISPMSRVCVSKIPCV
jgi:hypothetical protein